MYAAIDGIELKSAKRSIFLKNNPSDNALRGAPNDEACRALEAGRTFADSAGVKSVLGRDCNYSAFVFALERSLAAGLTVEFQGTRQP